MENLVGLSLAGYRLTRLLGKGGSSLVYLGEREDEQTQQDIPTEVAIKTFALDEETPEGRHSGLRRRFLREAYAMSRLQHPNILPVLDYGEEQGVTYMIEPFLTGGALSARLADSVAALPLQEIARYGLQMADALDYIHRQRLVHRDVKPSNMLLDREGRLYLADFGIARLFAMDSDALTWLHDDAEPAFTTAGTVLGTPRYMAPEQLRGEPSTPRSDVYALGVSLYQLVTGATPFRAEEPLAVALQHLHDKPEAPRMLRADLPAGANYAILRALAKNPNRRYSSAGEFAHAFALAIDPSVTLGRAAYDPVAGHPFSVHLDTLLHGSQAPTLAELGTVAHSLRSWGSKRMKGNALGWFAPLVGGLSALILILFAVLLAPPGVTSHLPQGGALGEPNLSNAARSTDVLPPNTFTYNGVNVTLAWQGQTLIAYHTRDQKQLWTFQLAQSIQGPLTAQGNTLYVPTANYLYELQLTNGSLITLMSNQTNTGPNNNSGDNSSNNSPGSGHHKSNQTPDQKGGDHGDNSDGSGGDSFLQSIMIGIVTTNTIPSLIQQSAPGRTPVRITG